MNMVGDAAQTYSQSNTTQTATQTQNQSQAQGQQYYTQAGYYQPNAQYYGQQTYYQQPNGQTAQNGYYQSSTQNTAQGAYYQQGANGQYYTYYQGENGQYYPQYAASQSTQTTTVTAQPQTKEATSTQASKKMNSLGLIGMLIGIVAFFVGLLLYPYRSNDYHLLIFIGVGIAVIGGIFSFVGLSKSQKYTLNGFAIAGTVVNCATICFFIILFIVSIVVHF